MQILAVSWSGRRESSVGETQQNQQNAKTCVVLRWLLNLEGFIPCEGMNLRAEQSKRAPLTASHKAVRTLKKPKK